MQMEAHFGVKEEQPSLGRLRTTIVNVENAELDLID